MKLIIEYSITEGYTTCQATVPFEYDSVEKLSKDIEVMTLQYLKDIEIMRGKYNAFYEKFPNGPNRNIFEKYYEESFKIEDPKHFDEQYELNKAPQEGEPHLTSGKSILRASDFIAFGTFFAPSVFTIDEWFETRGFEKELQTNYICSMCSDRGMVGGLMQGVNGYHSEPCPDCSSDDLSESDKVALDATMWAEMFCNKYPTADKTTMTGVFADVILAGFMTGYKHGSHNETINKEELTKWKWTPTSELANMTSVKGWGASYKHGMWIFCNDISPSTAKLFKWEFWSEGGEIPPPRKPL